VTANILRSYRGFRPNKFSKHKSPLATKQEGKGVFKWALSRPININAASA